MKKYFNCHNHTMYSNIRLIDCINKPKDLIDMAIQLGLSGIAITDHECLSGHVEALKYMDSIRENNPDFVLALGNEIYLTETRETNQKYYHFILIAKDAIGHKALRELSSTAWYNSYVDRRMERVPTLISELIPIAKKYQGHLIATSACIGGFISQQILQLYNDPNNLEYRENIIDFIFLIKDLFGEDFYLECAPGLSPEQIIANKGLLELSQKYKIKLVVGTDSHYLRKEDRYVHKSYLNSKEGDREVDSFYEFTYLMSYDEVCEHLQASFFDYESVLQNTLELQNKITQYSLFHKQSIPFVPVKNYPKKQLPFSWTPTLNQLALSDDPQDRYWVNQCWDKLNEIGKGEQYYYDTDDSSYITQLEEEARVKSIIGKKLETNMFQYPNTLQHYIDLFWECGSIVGAGRGSSCAALNHYLMGITQLDPLKWDLPFFRYLNEDRVELGDIDLDICPSKRPLILQKIKEERKSLFNNDLPEWAKDNLGVTLIATFGTEGTKSAVLSACRGYRSEDYPDGIDVDTAQYIASLIPQERGFLWPLHDVIKGNLDKGRKPITTFIKEVSQYPRLLEIIQGIEGLINKRSSHASGVIMFENDPFEKCCFMKTPKGEIITQFNLHDCEFVGTTKYDYLVTEVCDKIVKCIELLQKDNLIEPDLTLRQVYEKYLHPNILPIEDESIWDAIDTGKVLNVFQFDSPVGGATVKKLKPRNLRELSTSNGLMRLMGEEEQQRPVDKYYYQKNNIHLWYQEMVREGLTPREQEVIAPYFKDDYGVPPDQESLMLMLMDKDICNFTLGESNAARKIIGKKLMSKIPELKAKILSKAKSPALGEYIWRHGALPQVGYSFSRIHSLAYSFIGFQTAYLGTHWPEVYWDTACLIINSGSLDSDKETNTDYGKIAKALGDIIAAGIKISLTDINKSDFGFTPDVKNNQIIFGLKALLNVNDDLVNNIISNRPYSSPKDFYYRVHPNKQAMISLIKSGAFDNMMDRKLCMAWFIWETCDKKKRLTLQNLPSLIRNNLIPENTSEQIMARRIFEFNRYLKANCKDFNNEYYLLDERAINFLVELNLYTSDKMYIKYWDKIYQGWMNVFRTWINDNSQEILQNLNESIFLADWNKYAKGTISAWEMETMCFYFHEHELSNIDQYKYGFTDFYSLPETPEIDRTFYKNKKAINLYKLSRICGTCIAKDKVRSTVSLLTTSGVVTVKFRKEYFALFDKQISERQSDGTKKVIEKSWFNRGNMIIVTGMRSEDDFIVKKYASTPGHQLYHIVEVKPDNSLVITSERHKGEIDDE